MKILFALALMAAPFTASAERGVCTGFAQSCSMMAPAACTLQFGCSLNPVTFECGGMERQCELFRSRAACQMQAGCRWEAPVPGRP